jgi:hypothetical protein
MQDALATVNRLKAVAIVSASASIGRLSPEARVLLEDAIEQDLDAASHEAARVEARLARMEGQVHALSDAIVVIAAPSDAVDSAVQTVRDKTRSRKTRRTPNTQSRNDAVENRPSALPGLPVQQYRATSLCERSGALVRLP